MSAPANRRCRRQDADDEVARNLKKYRRCNKMMVCSPISLSMIAIRGWEGKVQKL